MYRLYVVIPTSPPPPTEPPRSKFNIESSLVWDTSSLTNLIYDLNKAVFIREASQNGDDLIFACGGQILNRDWFGTLPP